MSLVVDASAFYEVLMHSRTGEAVAPRLEQEPMAAPDIFDAEVSQVLRKAHLRGELDDDQLEDALVDLLEAPIRRISTKFLIRQSRAWWPNVTAYDALYLWVAAILGARVLTCDGRLSRASGFSVPVENVRVG